MNLDMSALGWAHSVACVVALGLGLFNIVTPKGIRLHRGIGDAFALVMALVCLSALGVYRLHKFWFPHWDAVATLALIAVGWGAARFKRPRRGWIYIHLTTMVFSYYMLIAGGVNEAFLRVDALRGLIKDHFFANRIISETHGVILLISLIVIAAFVIATHIGGRRRRTS